MDNRHPRFYRFNNLPRRPKRRASPEPARARLKAYPHPTVEMLEDLGAVQLDIHTELKIFVEYADRMLEQIGAPAIMRSQLRQLYRYLLSRLRSANSILQAGRAGPYAYKSTSTANRPARPGTAVKIWTM